MMNRYTLSFILAILFLTASVSVWADNGRQPQSQGRIEFDNQTPEDDSDDVIFDAKDLLTLENLVTQLEIKTGVLEEALK